MFKMEWSMKISIKALCLFIGLLVLGIPTIKADPNFNLFDIALINAPLLLGGAGILINTVDLLRTSSVSRFLVVTILILNFLLSFYLIFLIQSGEDYILNLTLDHHLVVNVSLLPMLLKNLRRKKGLNAWWIYSILLYILPQLGNGVLIQLLSAELFEKLTFGGILPFYYLFLIFLLGFYTKSYFQHSEEHQLKEYLKKAALISPLSLIIGQIFLIAFHFEIIENSTVVVDFVYTLPTIAFVGVAFAVLCYFALRPFYKAKV